MLTLPIEFFVLFILAPYYTFFLGSVVSTALDGKEFIMDEFTRKIFEKSLTKGESTDSLLNFLAQNGDIEARLILAQLKLSEAVAAQVRKYANPLAEKSEDWKSKKVILADMLEEMTKRIEEYE